ncbi:MAG: YggS family pyridoxal phosphate-dependent enzyme [Rhodoferax sp.]|nr:YggS family pyridoxal phosphate-dependent enzyme [Rhodoferax sp.]
MTTIGTNLFQVKARIAAAATACGRDANSIGLLAAAKTFPARAVREAFAAGQRAFGENYIQEGVDKIRALSDLPLSWHCIGPIQSNKTRLVAEHFDWVHTLDRLKIAERLNAQRPLDKAPLQVCIQVNIDGSTNKAGVAPEAAVELAQQVRSLPRLRLRGLMSIPEPTADFASACTVHSKVQALLDALNAQGLGLDTLSLGMSADLEAAIHSGSTLVRIGSAIFGERAHPG